MEASMRRSHIYVVVTLCLEPPAKLDFCPSPSLLIISSVQHCQDRAAVTSFLRAESFLVYSRTMLTLLKAVKVRAVNSVLARDAFVRTN